MRSCHLLMVTQHTHHPTGNTLCNFWCLQVSLGSRCCLSDLYGMFLNGLAFAMTCLSFSSSCVGEGVFGQEIAAMAVDCVKVLWPWRCSWQPLLQSHPLLSPWSPATMHLPSVYPLISSHLSCLVCCRGFQNHLPVPPIPNWALAQFPEVAYVIFLTLFQGTQTGPCSHPTYPVMARCTVLPFLPQCDLLVWIPAPENAPHSSPAEMPLFSERSFQTHPLPS